jgi:hypothetical protein
MPTVWQLHLVAVRFLERLMINSRRLTESLCAGCPAAPNETTVEPANSNTVVSATAGAKVAVGG